MKPALQENLAISDYNVFTVTTLCFDDYGTHLKLSIELVLHQQGESYVVNMARASKIVTSLFPRQSCYRWTGAYKIFKEMVMYDHVTVCRIWSVYSGVIAGDR